MDAPKKETTKLSWLRFKNAFRKHFLITTPPLLLKLYYVSAIFGAWTFVAMSWRSQKETALEKAKFEAMVADKTANEEREKMLVKVERENKRLPTRLDSEIRKNQKINEEEV